MSKRDKRIKRGRSRGTKSTNPQVHSTRSISSVKKENRRRFINSISDIISNGLLVTLLWKPNLSHPGRTFARRIIYILLPFVMVVLLACFIFNENLYNPSSHIYSFSDDKSTTFTVCFLFFFMYFVNGIFLYHFNNALRSEDGALSAIAQGAAVKRKITNSQAFVTSLSFMFSFVAIYFLHKAKTTGGEWYWFSLISPEEYVCYSILVIITLYSILRVVSTVIVNSINIFVSALKNKDQCKQLNLHALYNYYSSCLGIGISILISAGMFIFSDYYAFKIFNLNFAFHSNIKYVIGLLLLFLVFYFGTIILSWVSALGSTNLIIKPLSDNATENSHLIERVNTFWTFVMTALIPGIVAIIQLIPPIIELLSPN